MDKAHADEIAATWQPARSCKLPTGACCYRAQGALKSVSQSMTKQFLGRQMQRDFDLVLQDILQPTWTDDAAALAQGQSLPSPQSAKVHFLPLLALQSPSRCRPPQMLQLPTSGLYSLSLKAEADLRLRFLHSGSWPLSK